MSALQQNKPESYCLENSSYRYPCHTFYINIRGIVFAMWYQSFIVEGPEVTALPLKQ